MRSTEESEIPLPLIGFKFSLAFLFRFLSDTLRLLSDRVVLSCSESKAAGTGLRLRVLATFVVLSLLLRDF